MSWSENFQPAHGDLFFKSQKTGDPRLGEISLSFNGQSITPQSCVIAGYPDDEGIQLNSGRVGAKQAPDAIRSRFYKMSASQFHSADLQLLDLGNVDTRLSLADKHGAGKAACQHVLQNNGKWIGLGGGHDFGYADGAGFLLANRDSKRKPLILNFDAHLDVRPLDKGLSSGTPFYRLLTETDLPNFDLMEIGIQQQCNSQEHIQWLRDKNVEIVFFEDILMSGLSQMEYLSQIMAETLTVTRPTFVSIDIDGFSSAYAMGCSQAWPTGFTPNGLLPFLNILYSRLDVQALGIYEVSPPLDQDERTVKLAAQILHQFTGVIR